MQNETTQQATSVKNLDLTANPAPLGLLGFGMTTVLLNLHNAGFFELGSMILAMGIFYGGLAQIIAGIEEWKKNNTFGATAFTSYGAFWLTLVALLVLPKLGLAAAPDATSMAAYLAMWGIFTLVMFIGALKANRALQLVFATLAILFFGNRTPIFLSERSDTTKVTGPGQNCRAIARTSGVFLTHNRSSIAQSPI